MHSIEKEIREACGYKVDRKFTNRQDYLKSILNSANKMSDDDFDSLSDEAAGWVNAAITAINSKDDLPDFSDDFEPIPADDDEQSEDHDPETGEVLEADDEAESDGSDNSDDEGPDVGDDEEEQRPAPKAKRAKAPSVPRPEPKVVKKPKRPIDELPDVVMDKWGCMEGSKNSQALAMFEKGATAKEIKVALGGTYYNILRKMIEQGHKMEKNGHVIKLTHKDEMKKAKVKEAKK